MPEETKTKTGKVWVRRDFINAWIEHSEAKDWKAFLNAMNASRVKAGCDPYEKEGAGLSIQIGKIKKALNEAGYAHPNYPVRPTKAKPKAVSIEDDAAALGLGAYVPD